MWSPQKQERFSSLSSILSGEIAQAHRGWGVYHGRMASKWQSQSLGVGLFEPRVHSRNRLLSFPTSQQCEVGQQRGTTGPCFFVCGVMLFIPSYEG